MRARSTLIAFVSAALVALLALLVAGGSDQRDTAFSLDVSDNTPVAMLAPGRTLCQGPLQARAAFASIGVWASPARALDVELRAGTYGRTLGTTELRVSATRTGQLAIPIRSVSLPSGASFSVCIRNAGASAVAFEGGHPTRYSGKLTISGQPSPNAVAMLFARAREPSLISQLPDVFARASLFKLSWVGAWTFWLLAAAVIGAFGLAALAVASAADDELGIEDDA
ncbi:MAG: hypothetical protein ACYDHH_06420 [Solirubrobacteraceae bacterium]